MPDRGEKEHSFRKEEGASGQKGETDSEKIKSVGGIPDAQRSVSPFS